MDISAVTVRGRMTIASTSARTAEVSGDFDIRDLLEQIGTEECAKFFGTSLLHHFSEENVLSMFPGLKSKDD